MEWKHRPAQEAKATVMLYSGHENRVWQFICSSFTLAKTSEIQTGKRDQSLVRCIKWVKQGLSPSSL